MWIYSCLFRGVRNNSIYRELKNRLSLRLFDLKKEGLPKQNKNKIKEITEKKRKMRMNICTPHNLATKTIEKKRDKKKIGRRGKKEEKYFTH